MSAAVVTIAGSSAKSVKLLDVRGRLRCSQSSAVLGMGASFSLRTRLKVRFGDLPAAGVSSSIGSLIGFLVFFGFWRREASSEVLITGLFLPAVSG